MATYTIIRAGAGLKIVDGDNAIQYFPQPSLRVNPTPAYPRTVAAVEIRTSTSSVFLVTTDSITIDGAVAAGTLAGILDQLITTLSKPFVRPAMVSGGNAVVQTSATGSPFTAYGSQACLQATIINDSAVSIEVQQDGSGVALPILAGTNYSFFGLTNLNQLDVRRSDAGTSQLTIKARWEA